MRTWITAIFVAGVLGLGCSAVLAHTPFAVVSTPGLSGEAMGTSEIKFSAELAELGIEVEPGEATTAISRNAAVEVATKYEGERISHEAQTITAVYGKFSDASTSSGSVPITLPGTDRVMNNVPVWIVTFHGVHMLHSGPCMIDASGKEIPSTRDPYVFGDTNVVVDAETGEVLEGFSYDTPPVVQSQ